MDSQSKLGGAVLFLFAHQDDEFGVFSQITNEVRAGRRVYCAYFTDGSATAQPDRRERESTRVLRSLGVVTEDILFVGRSLSIQDLKLIDHTEAAANWLQAFLAERSAIDECFVPAWEGGHPDHDMLHAIAVEVLSAKSPDIDIWQFPLYTGQGCRGPFFRLQSPLVENGPVKQTAIFWRDRWRFVFLCLGYPSQWRSWLGLFPAACMNYLLFGVQQLQRTNRVRLGFPPHKRPLYYERRGFAVWHDVLRAITRHGESLLSRQ